jgi:hypothetical protein
MASVLGAVIGALTALSSCHGGGTTVTITEAQTRVVTAPGTTVVVTDTITELGTSSSDESQTGPNVAPLEAGWTYLSDLQPVATGEGSYDTESAETNGIVFPHPVELNAGCYNSKGGDMWVEFNLGRRFDQFRATVGLRDDANVRSEATYQLFVDGRVAAHGALKLGLARKIDVSVRRGLRLRIAINDSSLESVCSTAQSAWIVWGNARVY